MKKENGITIYEEDDVCALDEYSKELAKDIAKLLEAKNTEISNLQEETEGIKSTDTEQDKKIAELEKENIKLRNQIPNGQASGNNIHIEDSSDLELKWKLKGGHKQETRSGENLYNLKNRRGMVTSDKISTDDDDWITVTVDNSGETSGVTVNYFTKNLNLKPNTQYSLIAEFKKCTGDDLGFLNLVNNGNNEGQFNNEQRLYIPSIKENKAKKSKFIITTKTDLSNTKNGLRTYVFVPAKTSVSITFRLSVIENTSIELDNFEYEKYGISPSPDYPSETETVGSNINLFDKDNVNKINAYFDSTIHSNSANRVFWIKIDKNQDYTISKVKGKVFGIAFTDQLPEAGVNIYGTKYNNTGEVITTNSGSYDYLVCYYWSTSDVLTEQQIIDSIKIEKGTVATPYSPYGMGSVEIDVVNKNLFDKNNANKLSGYIDNSGYLHYDTNNKIIYVKCKTNTDYVISSKNIKGVAFFNKVPKTGSTSTNFKILTTTELTLNSKENTYLACWYYLSTLSLTEQEILNSIQIEQVLKATAYVEHQSQTVTMPVQQEMLEGDYVADVEHHEWGKIILTGEEDWTANWQNNDQKNSKAFVLPVSFFGNKIPNYAGSALKNNLSSHFSEIFSTVWSKDVDSVAINISPEYSFQIRLTKETLKYNDNVTNNELKILFQSWLKSQYSAGTPVIVYYKLATPVDLELTTEQKAIREQKLHTYKNVTNINLSDELVSIDVSYKKDVETITKNCVQKEDGKELSSNDYTNAEKEKLTNIEEKAEVNIVESIKKNGVALEVEGKAVDIGVPTKTSELTNDSSFQTKKEVSASIQSAINLTWESDL